MLLNAEIALKETPPHEVTLHCLGRSRYRVEFRNEVLINATDDPGFDACRALLARGITGKLRTRHASSAHWSMQFDVEVCADRRTIETATDGPRIGKWRPFDGIASEVPSKVCGGLQRRPISSSEVDRALSLKSACSEDASGIVSALRVRENKLDEICKLSAAQRESIAQRS